MTENSGKLFDLRVVRRNLEKGLIRESDYQSFLKRLPDEQNNAEWVQMDIYDTDLAEEATEQESSSDDSQEVP